MLPSKVVRSVGRLIGAMVATERLLLLYLLGLKEKERAFLLYAPVTPTGLFGTAVEIEVQGGEG